MKGTFFSADFVKDSNGNLRLLELNTDTALSSGSISQVDFTDFFSVLSNNNINTVEVIYKPQHRNFISFLSESIQSETNITSFIDHEESVHSIYPVSIHDTEDKFILRLAYDESAIFDSVYCKTSFELHKLFIDANETGSIPPMYMSSSTFFYNGLDIAVNSQNVPDLVLKGNSHNGQLISFYKVPTQNEETLQESFSQLLSEIYNNSDVVMNYIDTNESVHKSIRSFNIIYGSNLDIVNLATIEPSALFEKPNLISLIDGARVSNKHYYEFATNYPKYITTTSYGGVLETELISDATGSPVQVSETTIGDTYKSFYIEGAPDTDDANVFTLWNHPGQILPSGSYVTSSILVNKIKQGLPHNLISHLHYEGGSFRANGGQHMLIYDSNVDLIRYEEMMSIIPFEHKVFKLDGSVLDITKNDVEIVNEEGLSTYILDLEETDTFALYNADINIKIVTHNCFPEGTRILLYDGTYKNIEDLTAVDLLLTYNKEKDTYEKGRASSIRTSTQNKLVHLLTENGEEIKSTPLHRFYTENDGWKRAEKLQVNDTLFNKNGDFVKIKSVDILRGEFKVYHLIDVRDNHTYFAEDVLVHNVKISQTCFIAGTQITMVDGSEKNIEDVVIGDEVLSYNEETRVIEANLVIKLNSPIHDDLVEYTLSNDCKITSTFDHPYYVNGLHLASYQPNLTNERYNLPGKVGKIKVGDILNSVNGESVEIVSIVELDRVDTQTYIISVENNRNFYANKILVHNK